MAQNLGTINRLRASVSYPDFPELNILPAFLGKEGITVSPQGEITKVIPAMVGTVNSPEPYQIVEFSIEILKTTGLGDQYKQQWEKNSVLGDCVIRGDSSAMSDHKIFNSSIKSVDPIKMNGDQATQTVHMQGYYAINSDLYSA